MVTQQKIARRAFRAFEGYGLRIMPRRLLINNKKPSLSHLHWRDHAMIWQSLHSPSQWGPQFLDPDILRWLHFWPEGEWEECTSLFLLL